MTIANHVNSRDSRFPGDLICRAYRSLSRQRVSRVIKFALVGSTGIGVSVLILWLFTDVIGLFYVGSAVLSHILSVTNNFAWNELWTFRDKPKDTRLSQLTYRWTRFQITTLGVLVIYLSALVFLTDVVGIYYLLSSLCAIAIAFPFNFITSTLWVWREETSQQ